MYRNSELRKIALTITTAILVAGVLTVTQMQPNAAMASGNGDQIPSIITIPLEDLELDAGQFLLVADTTPEEVKEAHIAINVPCEDVDTDIDVVAGVAPDVQVFITREDNDSFVGLYHHYKEDLTSKQHF